MSEAPVIDRIIRSRRKTVALIVTPEGHLEVRAPQRVSRDQIEDIVAQKANWILKNLERSRKASAAVNTRKLVEGARIWYLGASHPLHVSEHSTARVQFSTSFYLPKSALPKATDLLTAWYKNQARHLLTERTAYYARQFGLKYRSIRITSARTRWGSCSRLNALSFTWRLVMAPLEIIDYIVIHELAHILQKNHSRAFWEQVERMLPDYRSRRAWLKANGRLLDLLIEADETRLSKAVDLSAERSVS
ncbi:MAG: SprT family zinc-dependent metalloprotease [Bellilinea sp.]